MINLDEQISEVLKSTSDFLTYKNKAFEYINDSSIVISKHSLNNASKMSLTTTCKDRWDYLEKALPTWLQFPFKEIVIIDWMSREPLRNMVYRFNDSRIKLITCLDEPFYRHSVARNFKVDMCDHSNYILSIDCDIMLTKKFLSNIILSKKSIFVPSKDSQMDGILGTSIFHYSAFKDIGGCNEHVDSGWGGEDTDLYNRFIEKRYNIVRLDPTTLYHIPHSDELRVLHTKIKSKWQSNALNQALGQKYKDEILNQKYTKPYIMETNPCF